MVALACGLAALEAIRLGAWHAALLLIVLAAVADGLDGALARRLRAVGPMGMQLDSLSDVITFGVAPAFLFASYFGGEPAVLRFGVGMAFVGAGVYRLARYNIQPTSEDFNGLPITIAGVLLAAVVAGPFVTAGPLAALLAIALAALMVSHHPFPKLTKWRWMLVPGFMLALVAVAARQEGETLAVMASVGLGAYVLSGLAGPLIEEAAHGIAEEVRAHARPGR